MPMNIAFFSLEKSAITLGVDLALLLLGSERGEPINKYDMVLYNNATLDCTIADEPKIIQNGTRVIATFSVNIARSHRTAIGIRTVIAPMPSEICINIRDKDALNLLKKDVDISVEGYFKPEEIKSMRWNKIILEITKFSLIQ